MWRLFVLASAVAALAAAGQSPNADYVRELFKANPERYSDDVFEDASLDVISLIAKYRYPIEVHHVTTEDGYILEMHRIPHGRDANNRPDHKKPVVFLMHGLSASSACWVLTGPGHALAYTLAEEGYDVWMGNGRGNTFSRRHVSLNPDASINNNFWKFSWDQIGNYDLPAAIDYILGLTGKSGLHYIGHSQGTTAFFVMGSLRPEYNDKIISMHAFAPVAYMANNQNPLLLYVADYAYEIETVSHLLGVGEWAPSNELMSIVGQAMCKDEAISQPVCTTMMFLVGGWNPDQMNSTVLPIIMGHNPAGASVRQFAHYGQGITGHEFRRYDYGNYLTNRRVYGSFKPPRYDLSKVTAPVFMHYAARDPLAHVRDVDRLFKELGRPVGKFLVPMERFNHFDFIWAIDARKLVHDRVINLMRAIDVNGLDAIVKESD